jgi:aminomethyltransferase
MLKRTALYEDHLRMGGRLIDFGGWELPVQYSGLMDEHETCRSAVGLFDVSHMGEVHVEGADSERYLNYLVTNNVTKIAIGQAQYTAMCHASGGIVDDLVIYRRAQNKFLVVVNASNTDKDFKHMVQVQTELQQTRFSEFKDLHITNESPRYTQIALQGRHSAAILSQITSSDLSLIKTYWFTEGTVLNGIPAILGRTGYTGEDGFEIYVAWEKGPEVWRALEEKGQPFGIKPCGLGARDTLRLEMKYPLYGNELNDETLPVEVGLNWVFKADKGDFLGKKANVEAKEKGLCKSLVGIKLLERGIPRHGYKVFTQDGTLEIGEVTSGTQSPSLKQSIGIVYLKTEYSKLGTRLTVDIRGTKVPAEIIPTPFYKRPY